MQTLKINTNLSDYMGTDYNYKDIKNIVGDCAIKELSKIHSTYSNDDDFGCQIWKNDINVIDALGDEYSLIAIYTIDPSDYDDFDNLLAEDYNWDDVSYRLETV